MRFKEKFEIRPVTSLNGHTNPDKWEVVKWCKRKEPARVYDLELGAFKMSDTYCFVIAYVEWNEKEPCWEFRSVGTRFLEYYEDGLCEFICKWLELADLTRGIDDEAD